MTHSLYLHDPDGNELELFIDVPGVDWREHPELHQIQRRIKAPSPLTVQSLSAGPRGPWDDAVWVYRRSSGTKGAGIAR